MPVTAKLSRKFYETFGDEITNELVEWFNAVDATYRADLRELNELNFQRFDAKLEQRIAELKAELRQEIAGLELRLREEIGAVKRALGHSERRVLRWMFMYWTGTVVTIVGALLVIRRFA